MKYSIIIPSYCNKEQQFNNFLIAIDSIRKNSPEDIELILVDDGSQYPLFANVGFGETTRVVHTENKGIPTSWNDGLRLARGEYIAIVNDDITVQEGWLDKLRMALEEDDDYWVAAPGVVGKQNGVGIEEDYQWFPGYCFMMHKSTRDTIGLFDEQFSPFNFEDTDYWTRVLQKGGKLVRNYTTMITHKEGHVLHTLDYDAVSAKNKQKFIDKHGFDPIPVFYEGAKAPWDNH